MPSRTRAALPAISPTVALIWQRARRTSAGAGGLLRRALNARRSGLGSAGGGSPGSCCLPREAGVGTHAGCPGERGDRPLQIERDLVELRQRVVVAEQAEPEMAVV